MTRSRADLLELLDSAHERVASLEAEFRDWTRPRPTTEVLVDANERLEAKLRWRGAGPWPRHIVRTRRVWAVVPSDLRVEVLADDRLLRFGIRTQGHWWRWDETAGAITGEIEPSGGGPTVPPLLDPALLNPVALLPLLRLEVAGVGVRAGRRVLIARGAPRRRARTHSYEFEFDSEHGTILRRAMFVAGICSELTEAVRVSYDTEIDAKAFIFQAPDGQPAIPVLPAPPRGHVPHDQDPGRESVGRQSFGRLVGQTVWLTGLSGAGKTSIALALEDMIRQRGTAVCTLDGDVLRSGLSADLGIDPGHREQARRAAHMAELISAAGIVAIVALQSPYAEDRALAKAVHDVRQVPFFEVWVDTPISVCEERDPEGLYARARRGELAGLTGVDAPYEQPRAPDLRILGADRSPEQAAREILDLLISASADDHERLPVSA